jgi:hypothetical protein
MDPFTLQNRGRNGLIHRSETLHFFTFDMINPSQSVDGSQNGYETPLHEMISKRLRAHRKRLVYKFDSDKNRKI